MEAQESTGGKNNETGEAKLNALNTEYRARHCQNKTGRGDSKTHTSLIPRWGYMNMEHVGGSEDTNTNMKNRDMTGGKQINTEETADSHWRHGDETKAQSSLANNNL